MTARSRPSRLLWVALAVSVAGLGVFGLAVSRAVSIEQVDQEEALRRFVTARAALGTRRPLLEIDENGEVTSRVEPPDRAVASISALHALAWQPERGRLIRADVPFWFFRVKGPAAQLALSETGLDLERLHLTPADLQRYGPAILIDHASPGGRRLLLWTE